MDFNFPTVKSQVAIIGRNGSGKTQFGAWLLSKSPFHKQPYIIVDYKGDELLNSIDRIIEIDLEEPIPKHPGLYIVHPKPVDDDDAIENWMRKIWARGNTGLYFDEGYMVPEKGALQGILTQGRSKQIPRIILTQRPSRVSRFVFSEANFYSVFYLQDKRDLKTVEEMLPEGLLEDRLPRYHSLWYDADADQARIMLPVPDADTICDDIDRRLSPKRVIF